MLVVLAGWRERFQPLSMSLMALVCYDRRRRSQRLQSILVSIRLWSAHLDLAGVINETKPSDRPVAENACAMRENDQHTRTAKTTETPPKIADHHHEVMSRDNGKLDFALAADSTPDSTASATSE